jgi:hypothetical protein
MARFIGYVQGQAGDASRLGSPRSGITAQAQGWNVGVKVMGRDVDGEDEFAIFSTGGSSGAGSTKHLGTVRLVDGVPVFTVSERYKVTTDDGLPFTVVV